MTTTPGGARPDAAADTRRNLLKKAAVGGAVAFAAPSILTRTAAAAASAEDSGPCCKRKGAAVRFRNLGGNASQDEVRLGVGDLGLAGGSYATVNTQYEQRFQPGTYDFTFARTGGLLTATWSRQGGGPSGSTTYNAVLPKGLNSVEIFIRDTSAATSDPCTVSATITSGPVTGTFGNGITTFGRPAGAAVPGLDGDWTFAGTFTVSGTSARDAERHKFEIQVGRCLNGGLEPSDARCRPA